jgi:hypothetical protein
MISNQIEKSGNKSRIDEISILKSVTRQIESLVPIVPEDAHKLIPRNQNKMMAETTKDMYMGGQMCE